MTQDRYLNDQRLGHHDGHGQRASFFAEILLAPRLQPGEPNPTAISNRFQRFPIHDRDLPAPLHLRYPELMRGDHHLTLVKERPVRH